MMPQSQMLSVGLQDAASGAIAAPAVPADRRSSSPETSEQSSGSADMSQDSDLSDDDSESEDAGVSDNETLAARHKSFKRTTLAGDHRRRTSSDSGSRSSANRKRRNLFPVIRKAQRCGKCHTCLNPQLKKACQTVREQMMREAGSQPAPTRRTVPQSSFRGPRAAADTEEYTKVLVPFVNSAGGISDAASVPAFIAALPKFSSSLSRFLPSTVLGLSSQAVLTQFMARGGVDVLSHWMLQAMEEDTEQANNLLVDILTTLKRLPVNKTFIQSTKSAKVIGALRKHDSADVRKLARDVVAVWMKAMPATSSKATSAKPALSKPIAAARPTHAASSTAQPAPKRPKLTQEMVKPTSTSAAASQPRPAANGVGVARAGITSSASAGGIHVVSDNDLFKVAARPKPPARLQGLNKQLPKKVQTIESSEAGRLLSSSSSKQPPPVPVQVNLQQQQQQLVQLQLRVDEPQQSVHVTILVTPLSASAGKPSAVPASVARPPSTSSVSRLAGRRLGFGAGLATKPGTSADSSISALLGGAWAQAGAGGDADGDGGEEPAAKKARKGPAKRVSWRNERELVAVRWFIKEDAPVKACKDAHLSEEQLHALAAAQQQHHSSFNQAARMEHMRERQIIEQQHKEAQDAAAHMRAQIEAMQPTTEWYGSPPDVSLDSSWGVAFGEESEAKQHVIQFEQLLTALAGVNPRAEPLESHQLLQPPSALFNVPYHDRNVKIIPLNTSVQAAPEQQPQAAAPPAAPGLAAGAPGPQQQQFMLAEPPQMQQQQQQALPGPPPPSQQQQQLMAGQPPSQQQQQLPVLLQLQQLGPSSAQGGQLVLQPINEPPLQQQQQQQQGSMQLFAGPPVSAGPNSTGDQQQQQQLMQALQSLSQGGFFQALQSGNGGQMSLGPSLGQQQLQQQMLQPPPQQQMLQPPLQHQQIPGMHMPAPPSNAPPQQHAPMGQSGVPVQVMMPDGQVATIIANGPPGQPVQLPPGVMLLPQQSQQQQQQQQVLHAQQLPGPPPFAPQQMQQQQFGPQTGGSAPVGMHDRVEHVDEQQDQRRVGGRGHGRGDSGRGSKGRGGGRGKHRHGDHGQGAQERRHNKRECKFFTSPRGCQKGDKCDFMHIMPGEQFDARNKRRAQ